MFPSFLTPSSPYYPSAQHRAGASKLAWSEAAQAWVNAADLNKGLEAIVQRQTTVPDTDSGQSSADLKALQREIGDAPPKGKKKR